MSLEELVEKLGAIEGEGAAALVAVIKSFHIRITECEVLLRAIHKHGSLMEEVIDKHQALLETLAGGGGPPGPRKGPPQQVQ